jgi:type IV secretory pathway VirB4 component
MATPTKSTQDFVSLEAIRDGIVLLRDGGLRGVLMSSSINFALKSADEQRSILAQFQNFLNSLDFSIQIFVQSRELDIRPYVALLESRHEAQSDDLMRIQTREYIEFVKNFTSNANIMSKSFFVVVPFTPAILQTKKGKFGIKFRRKKDMGSGDTDNFEENRTQLEQRISVVEQGLVRSGIRVVQLGTEEVIELLYKIFNPGELEKPVSLSNI